MDLNPGKKLEVLNQIGYEQYMKGEFFSAKLSLTWAIELHPNLASAHFNLGATYGKTTGY